MIAYTIVGVFEFVRLIGLMNHVDWGFSRSGCQLIFQILQIRAILMVLSQSGNGIF